MLNTKILIATTIMLVAVCQLVGCTDNDTEPKQENKNCYNISSGITRCEYTNGDVCYAGYHHFKGISCNFKNK